ncbi:hypothetical protein BC937DRAFT_90302, partial [Endogone sp. FLAS-F59071]
LLLAAEIGKSLLDNNIALKSKYEALLQQLQAYQEQQQQARYTVTLSAPAQNATQNATTTHTTHSNDSAVELNVISDNDNKSDVDAAESADDDAEGRPNRQRRLNNFQKSPEVESLEQEKYDLLAKLDLAIRDSEIAERTHNKKVRKLENEVQSLRAELESASKKVEDLEEMNEKLVQKQRKTIQQQQQQKRDPGDGSIHDDSTPEALIEKITVLEQEHEDITSAKEELEQKLASTVKDLNALKEQFDQVQLTQNDYIALQEAYQRQLKHISELNQSLEEHRTLLQTYGDNRSVSAWSSRDSPAPSESGSSRWSGRDGGIKRRTKPSLLSELENEFIKDMKQGKEMGSITESEENVESSDLSMTASTEASELSADKTAARTGSATANLTETSLASLYMSPAEMALESLLQQAGMKTCQMAQLQPMANYMEEAFDDYDDDEYGYEYERGSSYMTDIGDDDDSDSLAVMQMPSNEVQKNLGFFGRLFSWIFRLIRRIFRMIWRWCRFWGVLAAALLISIWKGPDAVLEKEAW